MLGHEAEDRKEYRPSPYQHVTLIGSLPKLTSASFENVLQLASQQSLPDFSVHKLSCIHSSLFRGYAALSLNIGRFARPSMNKR